MDSTYSPSTHPYFTEIEKFGVMIGVVGGVLLIATLIGLAIWWRKRSRKRERNELRKFQEIVVIRDEIGNSDSSSKDILDVTGGDPDEHSSDIFAISHSTTSHENTTPGGDNSNRYPSWLSDTSHSTDDRESSSLPNTHIGKQVHGKTTPKPVILPSLMYGPSRFADPWYDPLIERSLLTIQKS